MSTLYAVFSYTTTGLLVVGLSALAVATLKAAGRNEQDVKFLRGIREIETGNNPRAIGIEGEFTAYQFTLATWRDYTEISPAEALRNPRLADWVAENHLDWLRTNLRKAGVATTTYNLALAWHAGIGAVVRGSASQMQHDYARRVVHLVEGARS